MPNKFLSVQFNPDSDRFPIIEINEESIEFKVRKSDLTVRIKDYSDYSICDDINGDLIQSSEIFEDSNMTGQSVPIPAYFDENHLLPNKVLRVHSSGDLESAESLTEFGIPNPHITNHIVQTLSSEGLTEISDSTHLICQKLVEDSRGYTEKRKFPELIDRIRKSQGDTDQILNSLGFSDRNLICSEKLIETSGPIHLISRIMVEDSRGYTEKKIISEESYQNLNRTDTFPKGLNLTESSVETDQFYSMFFQTDSIHPDKFPNLFNEKQLLINENHMNLMPRIIVEDSRGYTEKMIFSPKFTEELPAESYQDSNKPDNLENYLFSTAGKFEITEESFIKSVIFRKFKFFLNGNSNKQSLSIKSFRYNVMLENITLFTKTKFEKYRSDSKKKIIYCYPEQLKMCHLKRRLKLIFRKYFKQKNEFGPNLLAI